MAKSVILASAGAGKTYHICHRIKSNERNLILAYTHENINNIYRELINTFGQIPPKTQIMTFDSFLNQHCICPYFPIITKFFKVDNFNNRGITLSDPPAQNLLVNGKRVRNARYFKKDEWRHYINDNGFLYLSQLSELVLVSSNKENLLVTRITERLNKFFDNVLIDEFQDYRCHDFDLIVRISKELSNIILVGDYYQHSIIAKNNSGKPFKTKSRDVSYQEFCSLMKRQGFEVDESSLCYSRRCNSSVCEFVNQKLGIPIVSANINHGFIKWADDDEIPDLLTNDSIMKLVWSESDKYKMNSINWSKSKGNTYPCTCVILTEKYNRLDKPDFSTSKHSQTSINKLYVALTRSSGDVYLINRKQFNKAYQALYLDSIK